MSAKQAKANRKMFRIMGKIAEPKQEGHMTKPGMCPFASSREAVYSTKRAYQYAAKLGLPVNVAMGQKATSYVVEVDHDRRVRRQAKRMGTSVCEAAKVYTYRSSVRGTKPFGLN